MDELKLIAVHTVPIWEDPDAPMRYRPPLPGEERDDLKIVGWGNVHVIEGLEEQGVKRYLLTVLDSTGRFVSDDPPVGDFG